MTSVVDPPAKPRLPFKQHPIYALRRLTLYAVAIAALLTLITQSYPIVFLMLIFSALFIIHDLVTWSLEKFVLDHSPAAIHPALTSIGPTQATSSTSPHPIPGAPIPVADDDESKKPAWPKGRVILPEALLTLFYFLFALLAFGSAVDHSYYYYNGGLSVLLAYAALSYFLLTLLHGKAFLIEYRAWKKDLARLRRAGAPHCTHCSTHSAQPPQPWNGVVNTATEWVVAGPLGPVLVHGEPVLHRWKPESAKSTCEEERDVEAGPSDPANGERDFLINTTPEGSSSGPTMRGYGAIENSVQSLKSEGEELVGKKGKRRVVGEEWYGKDDVRRESVEDV